MDADNRSRTDEHGQPTETSEDAEARASDELRRLCSAAYAAAIVDQLRELAAATARREASTLPPDLSPPDPAD